ncbi:ube2z, partial [Symbiodinium sp. KB8]
TSAPMAEPQAGTFEAMAPASTLDMTRDAVPNREDIDQAKRKIMEQARAQTRMTAAKTT